MVWHEFAKLVEWSGGATGLDQWLPFVSALSGIMANSPRVMPTFPPPPLFIPYGGVFPVRLEDSLVLLAPSESFRGFVCRRSCRSSVSGHFVSRRLERRLHPQALGSARFIMSASANATTRSEEHTSELQSPC